MDHRPLIPALRPAAPAADADVDTNPDAVELGPNPEHPVGTDGRFRGSFPEVWGQGDDAGDAIPNAVEMGFPLPRSQRSSALSRS